MLGTTTTGSEEVHIGSESVNTVTTHHTGTTDMSEKACPYM